MSSAVGTFETYAVFRFSDQRFMVKSSLPLPLTRSAYTQEEGDVQLGSTSYRVKLMTLSFPSTTEGKTKQVFTSLFDLRHLTKEACLEHPEHKSLTQFLKDKEITQLTLEDKELPLERDEPIFENSKTPTQQPPSTTTWSGLIGDIFRAVIRFVS